MAPGRQKPGVDVDEAGPGLLKAPGQFLERLRVEGRKRLGHHRVENVQIVRSNDQVHAILPESSARTNCHSASIASRVWDKVSSQTARRGS